MAHGGGGGGGKKKPSFLRSCLTSTIVLIVGVYVIVLLGSAAITTLLKNRGTTTLSVSTASTQPTVAPQPPIVPTAAPALIVPQNGSNSAGGVGNGNVQSFVPSNPSIGPIQVTSGAPYYIVEQGDLAQNGQILSFNASMSLIAAKLLTTVDALKQTNAALSSGTLTAGQVLIVPSAVVTGGGGGNLPPTGEYASP